jgi:hypothetical protein
MVPSTWFPCLTKDEAEILSIPDEQRYFNSILLKLSKVDVNPSRTYGRGNSCFSIFQNQSSRRVAELSVMDYLGVPHLVISKPVSFGILVRHRIVDGLPPYRILGAPGQS